MAYDKMGNWVPDQPTSDRMTAFTGSPQVSYGTDASSTGWTAPKGTWNAYTPMGDNPTQYAPGEGGWWSATPGVDYGQSPGAGYSPYFNKEGIYEGWMPSDDMMSTGGSKLFGDFGETKQWTSYIADPKTGELRAADGSTTPSKSSGTNFMSYAMPIAMMAGLGAGAAGGAFTGVGAAGSGATTGMTAAEAAALGSEAAGGITGIGAGGATAAEAAAASGLYGAGTAGAGGGSFMELVAKYGPKVAGALTQMGGGSGAGGQGGAGGGGMGLLDLLGAYYSSQQMKDYSGNLKGMYSTIKGQQDETLGRLKASYDDPNSFYDSNQWKGLESVYQNQVDRGAAKTGRLSNPTDREVLLQQHGMKELENYRKGLREEAGINDPSKYAEALAKGYQAEAYANTAPFATAARGGTGATVGNIVGSIGEIGSGIGEIWNWVSEWFDE